MCTLIIILRLLQLVCLLVILLCMISRIIDVYNNNHFVDDKGRRYKRTKDGFKYY